MYWFDTCEVTGKMTIFLVWALFLEVFFQNRASMVFAIQLLSVHKSFLKRQQKLIQNFVGVSNCLSFISDFSDVFGHFSFGCLHVWKNSSLGIFPETFFLDPHLARSLFLTLTACFLGSVFADVVADTFWLKTGCKKFLKAIELLFRTIVWGYLLGWLYFIENLQSAIGASVLGLN